LFVSSVETETGRPEIKGLRISELIRYEYPDCIKFTCLVNLMAMFILNNAAM
jgi:hypothetical protein